MNLLDQIAELSAGIEEKVAAGDWSGATTLDQERRTLLTRLVSQGQTLDRGTREILEQLHARNEQLIAGVRLDHQAVAGQVRRLNGAAGAVRAYEVNVRTAPALAAGE